MGPDPALTPELVQAQAFTSGFRGYDQREVRDFLHRVSTELRSLRERAAQLESAWHSAEERAARPPVLDEDTLMAAVGEETAAILRAARGAAADLRSRAGDDAERIVAEARADGERIRAETEGLLTRETQAAEEAAARIVEGARTEAAEMLDKARSDADSTRTAALHEKQLTIEGASSTRERILDDLARRRRVAAVQIEQLRAGRERLLESYAVVRRTLEEVHNELTRADAEARAAADEAGRRMHREYPQEPAGPPAATDAGVELESNGSGADAGDDAAPAGAGTADAGDSNGTTERSDAAPVAPTEGPSAPVGAAGATADALATDKSAADREPAARTGDPAPTPARAATTNAAPSAVVAAPIRTGRRAGGSSGDGPAAAGAEALVPVSDHVPSQEAPPVPHLRVVPDPVERSGSKVDQLFARIRAGRVERQKDAPAPAPSDEEAQIAGESRPVAAAVASDAGAGAAVPGAEAEVEAGAGTGAGGDAVAGDDAGDHDAEPAARDAEPEAPRSDADEGLLQRREEALDDLEMSLTRKLKRALQDEQNDLLDRMRNLRGEPTAPRLLPNRDEQIARYASAAQPVVDRAAAAGVAFAVRILQRKGRANASAPPVADLARDASTSIVDALRRRLEQAIAASIGDEQQVMVEAVGGAYREWKSQRVERIAGDALAAAFARGTWSEAPEGTPLRWVVDDADGPCPDCDDNALAGSLPRGESFPTGQRHPPAHSGCRCLLVPVVS
jgi:DivIVA domain-containing protein